MPETMRSRNLCALTNWEVEQYLKRNDVIFIPVGTAELHGPLPLDCEYVSVEALAYKLAEQCDGLVLPHMVYFHPGATDIGRGDGLHQYDRWICLFKGYRSVVAKSRVSAAGVSHQPWSCLHDGTPYANAVFR